MVFLSLWEKFNQKDVGSVDPINDFSPRAVTSQQTSVLAVILRWRGRWWSTSLRLLAVIFHAVFERGQSGFWHLLWTKFSSLHLDLPNWTIRKQFHFLSSQGLNKWKWLPGSQPAGHYKHFYKKLLSDVKHDVVGKAEAAIAAFLLGFSLTWLELCLTLTVLSWSQHFAFISPLIKWKWNYTTTPPLSSFQ